MAEAEIDLTGAEKPTKYLTQGEWKGASVQVVADTMCTGHDLQPVDHYGQPTEYLMCIVCLGIAVKPEQDPHAT